MFSLQDITSQILHEIVRLYLFTLSICQEQPGTGLTIMNECQNNFGTATAATTIQQQEDYQAHHLHTIFVVVRQPQEVIYIDKREDLPFPKQVESCTAESRH